MRSAVGLVLALSIGIANADYTITRHTIDGGGVVLSVGGEYELSGTIGQCDAGEMLGGTYSLTGGFWFQTPRGDCNADGVVNLFDNADFVPCLDGPGDTWTDPACRCFDFDADDDIDLHDFSMFTQAFAS